MCFSATTSFAMAGVLASGGALCLQKSAYMNQKYLPLAVMPVVVSVQQFMEGLAWIGAESGQQYLLQVSALSYMFFVWVFWPSWISFMVSKLEPDLSRKKILEFFAAFGFIFGLLLYLPYFIYPDWLQTQVLCHSLDYQTKIIPDQFIPRPFTAALYLALVGATPLLSSHRQIRLFGWSLIFFVPITHLIYSYAYISVLCFFAAFATIHLIYIVTKNKCHLEHALIKAR